MGFQLIRIVAPGEYTKLRTSSPRLTSLWLRLDEYTSQNLPVVIVDNKGEIRAGNLLGYHETIDKGIMQVHS